MTRASALLVLLLAAMAREALAHGGEAHGAEGFGLTLAPLVLVPLGLAAVLYGSGMLRLWRRLGAGRGVRGWQAASFWAGWVSLALALVSPLHALGEQLFTAHMIEHAILMAVAAPLLVLARPSAALAWGLPARLRGRLPRLLNAKAVRRGWRLLTDPLLATVLHGVALWAWHLRAPYALALQNPTAHWLQHVSFLATALLFWWAMLREPLRGTVNGPAVFYLFVTTLHSGFLGILFTFARTPMVAEQGAAAARFGLTPLEDQQLAGLVMWVPAGLVYACAALALAGLWIGRSAREAGHAPRAR